VGERVDVQTHGETFEGIFLSCFLIKIIVVIGKKRLIPCELFAGRVVENGVVIVWESLKPLFFTLLVFDYVTGSWSTRRRLFQRLEEPSFECRDVNRVGAARWPLALHESTV
jgi:hypothetical protein